MVKLMEYSAKYYQTNIDVTDHTVYFRVCGNGLLKLLQYVTAICAIWFYNTICKTKYKLHSASGSPPTMKKFECAPVSYIVMTVVQIHWIHTMQVLSNK
jgi:hypothetical protein